MARLSTRGAREKEAILKKGRKDKKVGSERKLQKNSSSDEREMQQQIPTSETKAEERANAKDETLSTAALGASSAAVDVSAGSLHDSYVEHEHNEQKIANFIKSVAKFIYHDGYVCNRTISTWIVTIAYLLCIYISLALLVTGTIYIMLYNTRDAPVYYGETTFIGGVPGIGFEPRKRSMRKEQNVFKWYTSDPTSYAFYIQRLRKILYWYAKMEKMPSKFKMDCERTIVPHVGGKPVKHFCKTDVTSTDENYGYGACALRKNTKFGYDIGAPCVMLRINKLFGYYPEQPTDDLFANSSLDFETNKTCGEAPNATVCCNDDRMLFECSPLIGIKCVPTAPDLRGRSLTLWFEITRERGKHVQS